MSVCNPIWVLLMQPCVKRITIVWITIGIMEDKDVQ